MYGSLWKGQWANTRFNFAIIIFIHLCYESWSNDLVDILNSLQNSYQNNDIFFQYIHLLTQKNHDKSSDHKKQIPDEKSFLFNLQLIEPPLMDTSDTLADTQSCSQLHTNTTFLTSHKRTPLLSGHLVMFPATYKHYIFNLP